MVLKRLRKVVTMLLFAATASVSCLATPFDPLEYLRSNYPKLTNEYEDELLNFPVHYIFAVDVSGTMVKYSAQVDSALVPFIQALPDNDYVTFIRFGTTAKDNEAGYNSKISSASKATLISNIHHLYTNTNDDKAFRQHTDIFKAIKGISDVEKRRQEAKQNVVIIITDFRNEDASGVEQRFTSDQLEQMNRMMESANFGKEARNVALKLNVDESKPGYCLDQLRESVFPTEGKPALQIVPVGNDPGTINSWFEQLRRDIMVNKLKAIIDIENRAIDIDFSQSVSIDGDVKTQIHWKPTRLYRHMKIDSSKVAEPNNSGFRLKVNGDEIGEKKELEFESELGQLKHSGFGFLGFHHMTDSLQLGVDMPTDFDDELKKLDVIKPISTPKQMVDRWIFTLPIPFWLAATIVALLIIYILLVLNQIKKNASHMGCFKGEIKIRDFDGYSDTVSSRIMTYTQPVVIGKNGAGKLKVADAEWSISLRKKTCSVFIPFGDPELVFKVDKGFASTPSHKNGVDGFKCSGTLTVTCGPKKSEQTHKVVIRVIS